MARKVNRQKRWDCEGRQGTFPAGPYNLIPLLLAVNGNIDMEVRGCHSGRRIYYGVFCAGVAQLGVLINMRS